MNRNILNSKGVHVGIVARNEILGLRGQKIYKLKGSNIYKLNGDLGLKRTTLRKVPRFPLNL